MSCRGVLFIAPRFHMNMTGWVEALVESGIPVRILVITKGFTEDYLSVEPELIVPSKRSADRVKKELSVAPSTPPEDIWRGFFRPDIFWLARQIKSSHFEVVVLREETRMFFVVSVLIRLFSPRTRVVLYHQRPLTPIPNRKSVKKGLRNQAIRLGLLLGGASEASPVLARNTLSDREFEDLTKTHGNKFLPFLINKPQPEPLEREDGVLRVLGIGKFREYKSWDVLVGALKALPRTSSERIEVRIIGQARLEAELAYLQKLEQELRAIPHLRNLVIQPNVDPKLMGDMYRWATCTLLTSRYEVAAVAPLEGMGFGAFPLVTSENGTNCYFEDGKSGLTFRAGDLNSLSRKLHTLVSQPALTDNLRRGARETISVRSKVNDFFSSLQIET